MELEAVPLPNRAVATVPDPKLVAFKAVKFAPLAAGNVAGKRASGTVPEVKLLALKLVRSTAAQVKPPVFPL